MRYISMLWALFIIPFSNLQAQVIKGRVNDKDNKPIIGANIYWSGSTIGTNSNLSGYFELKTDTIHTELVASYIGYLNDTIQITELNFVTITLKEVKSLNEVVITESRPDTYISNDAAKTEVITQDELQKSSCCDLGTCFETQGTVQPQTTNVITNSKELRILGLSGVYNQVLIDGMPLIQGLSYTYGIGCIPGTLIDNIFVSKGTTSVLQGYESISGQINVVTKDGEKGEKLLLNAYMNSFLEKQFNTHYSIKKQKWNNITAFHTAQPGNKFDRDNDNFLDLPLLTRYMLYNKFKYRSEDSLRWSMLLGTRLLTEQRVGGQILFNPSADKATTNVYGQTVNVLQPDIYLKTGYRFNDDNKLTLFSSFYSQTQNSCFGTAMYDANQNNFYANLQYERFWKEKHTLKTGISYRHIELNEIIAFGGDSLKRSYAGIYRKLEEVPGLFLENNFKFFDEKLTWITAVRADLHNQFGARVTPRTMIKYDIKENNIIRASVGTGWRTVNIFSENVNLLSSSRDVLFIEQLKPEQAINYGVNFTRKFKREKVEGSFTADFYRTEFQNQVFPDYDSDPTKAIISNFTGTSVSNGFQADLNLKFVEVFDVKLVYNYLDVYRIIKSTKYNLPFNSNHKFLVALSYEPLSEKWHLNTNIHWYGSQILPNTESNPVQYQTPNSSKPYTLVNVQFTRVWKKIEVYIGCENIFDFRQKQPITSWRNPFSPYFDTSSVWGPTRGREVYVGVRFKII